MRAEIQNDVSSIIRARIGCVWIKTYEEREVVEDLKELLRTATHRIFSNMSLQLWSRTEGVQKLALSAAEKQEEPDTKLAEFKALFKTIRKKQMDRDNGSSNLWILRDFNTVIHDAAARRLIRDLKEYPGYHYNPIVVISPTLELPDDISHLFRVVEYSLPTEEAVHTAIKAFNDNLRSMASQGRDVIACSEDEVDRISKAALGLTTRQLEMALWESAVRFRGLSLDFIAQNKIDTVKKTGVLDYRIPKISLDDIGGNEVIKEWFNEEMAAFDDEAADFGLAKPKGYMAVGIAGCGKTAMAEAIASSLGVPLLELSMSKIMDKLVGQSEQKIAHALDVAKACAPCVLLLDEVEKMLGSATLSSNASDGGVTNRILQSILKFMNDNDSGVYVVMTANDVSQLPPEFTRAGRIDATWYFGLPTSEERESILSIHFAKKGRSLDKATMDSVVEATDGFTGAELKQVVEDTMRKAYARYRIDGNREIIVDDVIGAANEVIPVSQSSREKILALDNYCSKRARPTSRRSVAVAQQEQETRNVLDFSLDDL